jgi:periplasmic protein CpxP/Spy
MMGMMGGVDPVEMKRMVENCNRMMESMMRDQPTTPPVPPAAPQPDTKG